MTAAKFASLSGDDAPALSFWEIRRRLGKDGRGEEAKAYSGARMVKYLGLLIADQGFPPPFPCHRRVGGFDQLVTRPCPQSVWPRDAVDAWLANFLTPASAAAIDVAAMRHAAGDMDSSAFGLQLVRKAA